jgi:hypothetical protein
VNDAHKARMITRRESVSPDALRLLGLPGRGRM